MLWKIFGRQNDEGEYAPIVTEDENEVIEKATPGTVIVADPNGDEPEVYRSERGGWWSKL